MTWAITATATTLPGWMADFLARKAVLIMRATSSFCGIAFRVPAIAIAHANPDAKILKENSRSEQHCGYMRITPLEDRFRVADDGAAQ
ncbi:MAG: hypothetical protein Q7K20_09295 [Polaromonas sp.]|jgi:hypothetical protein|nr:hypothetical protein [Polaromonas sp.]